MESSPLHIQDHKGSSSLSHQGLLFIKYIYFPKNKNSKEKGLLSSMDGNPFWFTMEFKV